MLHTNFCSCRGIRLNKKCTSFEHTCSPIRQVRMSPSPFPSTCWSWYPPFHWWFPSWNEGYVRLGGIYFYLNLFTMSFFWWPFGYGVWTFMKLFCPRWFYEYLWLLCQCMWAHCLRSYSTFNITFSFSIPTLNIGEVVWKHMSHHDW
jgi:hypothetical protein